MSLAAKRKKKAEKWQRYVSKKPPEWYVWRGMKKRCYYQRHKYYEYYGGKGITVCDRWLEHGKGFQNFLEDMGDRPSTLHDLDRVDANGNYCKENCRWLTQYENRGRPHKGKTKDVVEQETVAEEVTDANISVYDEAIM